MSAPANSVMYPNNHAQHIQVAPEVCLEQTAGNNTCKWACDEWGRQVVEQGWGLCDAPADVNTTVR